MEAETRRKVEEMVIELLQKSNIEETTEFTIRVAASERLGIDLSDSVNRQFVRTIIENYLLTIATDDKPPQNTTEVPVKSNEPPQVSTEVVIPNEQPPKEFTDVVRVKRKNDDSDHVICQLSTRRNVVVKEFKGMTLVSIREFYQKDGKQLPTSKGISLSSEQWSTFKNSVPAIEEAIAKMERRIRPELNIKKNGEVPSSVNDVVPSSVNDVPVEPVHVPIEIVRFDGKNYQIWAQQMELLLKQSKINYVLTDPCPNASSGEKDPSAGVIAETKAAEKRWVNDDLICRRNILSHLSDNLFNKYANRKMSAKELWEEVKFVYLYEEHGTKRSQVKKYIEFQMVDEKPVVAQIQELNNIADSLAAAGMHIEENFHVSVIISKLPLSWKDFCIKLMREEHLPFWKLMESVTKEEEFRDGVKEIGEPPSDSVRFHRANKGGPRGDDIKPPPGFQRKYEPNGKNIACYICGQNGHISRNCWRWV